MPVTHSFISAVTDETAAGRVRPHEWNDAHVVQVDLASSEVTGVLPSANFDKTGNWTGTFDGQEGTYYLSRANHTGTQTASTVSDFDEASQDAVGAMLDSTLVYADATPALGRAAISGDITISAGSNVSAITSGVIINSDINASAAIDATKIANGSVSSTEFQYLDGVTSAIQTQIDGKQPLDSTLTALAAYNTNGLIAQTATDTFAGRTLTAPAAGFTITNGDGVSGNPTFVLSDDLSALEALNSTGYIARTGSNTYALRSNAGTANEITVSNGGGTGGSSQWSLPTALTFTGKTVTGGSLVSLSVVQVGGNAARATTAGTNRVDIFDGTAPVGTLANGISLYSTAGELRVMDAAGNATLLSPHDQETNDWIYFSKNTVTGKVLRIDMERMMKALDAKLGGGFVQEYMEPVNG